MGCQVDKSSSTHQIQIRSKYKTFVGLKFQEAIENNNPQSKNLLEQWSYYPISCFQLAQQLKEKDPKMFQKLLMNGALASNRWNLWKASLYVPIFEPDLYNNLLLQMNPYEELIEKDLIRTLPCHCQFREKQDQLKKVLKAVALYNKGYVTGMNQVTGFFLLVNGMDEEEAFWMMNYLNANPQFKFLSLFLEEPTNSNYVFESQLMDLFHRNFKILMPELYKHFQDQGIDQYCYVWPWMFTLFLQTFPFEVVLYFFDFMIANNILAAISLSLALLKHFQACLLQKQQMEIGQFIQQMSQCENVFLKSKKPEHLCVQQIIQLAKKFQEELGFNQPNIQNILQ